MQITLEDGIKFVSYILALAFIIIWFLPLEKWVGLIVSACICYAGYLRLKEDGKRDNNRKQQQNKGKSD